MLQCVVVRTCAIVTIAVCCSVLQCVAVCCTVLQFVAVCCSVMQCVVLCYSTYVCCRDKCSGVDNFLKSDHICFGVCARGERATELENGCDCVCLTRVEVN